jgi:hypothetical protein
MLSPLYKGGLWPLPLEMLLRFDHSGFISHLAQEFLLSDANRTLTTECMLIWSKLFMQGGTWTPEQ